MINKRIISRSRMAGILYQYQPIETRLAILNLAYDESLHPHVPKGEEGAGQFAPKQRNKKGQIRYMPKKGETHEQAYRRKVNEKRLERKFRKEKKDREKYKIGESYFLDDIKERKAKRAKDIEYQKQLKEYQRQAYEDHYNQRAQEVYEEQYQKHSEANKSDENEGSGLKETLTGAAVEGAKEAGAAYGIHKVGQFASKLFRRKKKSSLAPETINVGSGATKAARTKDFYTDASGITRKGAQFGKYTSPIARQVAHKNAVNSAMKAFQAAGGKAGGKAANEAAKKAFQSSMVNVAKSGATYGIKNANKAGFLSKAGKVVGTVVSVGSNFIPGGIAAKVGVAAAIAASVYGYKKYKQHKLEEAQELHERALMEDEEKRERARNPENEDREFHKQLREETAREVARQASIYATKQYAKAQVDEQKRAIDEELNAPRSQKRIKKSAKITAYAAAKEYAKREKQQAYQTRESDKWFY